MGLCLIFQVAVATVLGVGSKVNAPDLYRLLFPTTSTNGDRAVLHLGFHPRSSSLLHLSASDQGFQKERRAWLTQKTLGVKVVASSPRRSPHLAGLGLDSVDRSRREWVLEILPHHRQRTSPTIGDLLDLHVLTASLVSRVTLLYHEFAHSLACTTATTSTPPTPQMGRRKLELMPRTGPSAASSPLSSPRMGPASSGTNTPRSNPFGDAK
jgi:hypothetical protein